MGEVGSQEYAITKQFWGHTIASDTYLISDLEDTPLRRCDGESCELVFRRNTLLEAVFEVSRHTGYRRNCSVIWLGWAASGSVEILGNASTSVTIHTTTEASLLEVLSGS